MKILKSLNNKIFIILISYFFPIFSVIAEDKPIDIWDLKKNEPESNSETKISPDNIKTTNQSIVYELQASKQKDTIKLDKEFSSKDIKIVGLYDPSEYGLSIDMWSNSDGMKLKNLFENIDKFNLSEDASEIMHISLLTNAYFPNENISEKEFMSFKSDWLIKNADLELIEEYLIKNQIINMHPNLTIFLVDSHLSNSNLKKSCEIFSKNTQPIQNEYLSKFNLYCLINYGKNEEAQLILDLKKEQGFKDKYFENKINYLFGYLDEPDKEVSVNSILDFHLAHRINPEFFYEPSQETPKLIWKYLSAANLIYKIEDLEVTEVEKISTIEKAVNDKNYSEEELFEFYKKFQFNINQFLNAKEVYKSLSSIEGRALLYQRILLTEEPKLKIELIKTLKDLFISDNIGEAFDLELKEFLGKINADDIPSNFTTFYNSNLNKNEIVDKKIRFNNKILHQSKLINYFNGDYAKSKIEEDLDKFLKKIKKDKKYSISKKDIIFLEALKSDGIEISKKYDGLYEIKKTEMPADIQKMIDNDEVGAALLRVIEVIGSDKIENIDEDTIYFIINTLNQLDVDLIRNKLLLKVLPLKV